MTIYSRAAPAFLVYPGGARCRRTGCRSPARAAPVRWRSVPGVSWRAVGPSLWKGATTHAAAPADAINPAR
jgi:hypothetical protein